MSSLFNALLILTTLMGCKVEEKSIQSTSSDQAPNANVVNCTNSIELKGNRLLGFDILDNTETGTFSSSLNLAKEAGAGFIALHVNWNQIETAPQTYTDPLGSALSSLSSVASANGLKFSLTVRPIDLTGKTVPSDLADDPTNSDRFNTGNMINRFTAMLNHIFSNYIDVNVIHSLQIGNEIDHYNTSAEHSNFWSDYGHFLNGIRIWMNNNYPNVKIGYTITYNGAVSGNLRNLGVWTSLASVVDVIGITYYPQDTDFQVLSPGLVHSHLATLVSEFSSTNKPVYLQEVGYQTGTLNSSSETLQAQFFCNFFAAWDSYKTKILSANIVRLNDVSLSKATSMAGPYGGASNAAFVEYLRTLGLRTHSGLGANKKAYEIIKEEALDRGF